MAGTEAPERERVQGSEGSGITSRYATFADYQDRESGTADSRQGAVESMLTAMSRSLDRKLGVFPGGFTARAGATFVFHSFGGRRLWLRDESSYVYPLRSVVANGIRADFDETGDYATTPWSWDFDDVFVWPVPRNHVELGEPARAIELRSIGGAPRTIWPYADGSVQIEGDWGWDPTPPAITELVVSRTRDLRDVQRGGAASVVADIASEAIPFTDDSWRLWMEVQEQYSYRRAPAVGRRR